MHKQRSKWTDGWDRLTLKQYNAVLSVDPESEDAGLAMAAAANGMTLKEAYDLPINETHDMAEAFSFARKAPKVRRMKDAFTLNGREYVPVCEPSKITTAQYIDYDQLPDKRDLIEVLGCVMVPPGHIYNDGYPLDQAKLDMQELSVEEAVSVCDFFTRGLGLYGLVATRTAMKALKQAKRDGMDVREQERTLRETRKRFRRLFLLGLTA